MRNFVGVLLNFAPIAFRTAKAGSHEMKSPGMPGALIFDQHPVSNIQYPASRSSKQQHPPTQSVGDKSRRACPAGLVVRRALIK